jgi:hypothetical protein
MDPQGASAELVRYEGIRIEQQRLDAGIRVRLWQCRIEETKIADLSTFDLIESYGPDPARIVEDSQRRAGRSRMNSVATDIGASSPRARGSRVASTSPCSAFAARSTRSG